MFSLFNFKFHFVTGYFNQHNDIKKMQKHWKVLKSDRILGPNLPEVPHVNYRGVPPLKLQVAPNIVDPPKQINFSRIWEGFIAVGNVPFAR